jgi:hypothetical protein
VLLQDSISSSSSPGPTLLQVEQTEYFTLAHLTMTMSRPESTTSPLAVKEQFEASANRFWSSVRNLNIEDAMKGNSSHSRLKRSSSTDSQAATVVHAVSFQSVIHAMFGSCTTGVSSEGHQNRQSMSTSGSSIAPAFSREESHTEPHLRRSFPLEFSDSSGISEHPKAALPKIRNVRPVTSAPVAPRIDFLQDNRDRAEEAVLHLREQQIQQRLILQHGWQHQSRQNEYERIISCRAVVAKSSTGNVQCTDNKQATSTNPSRPVKDHPSFFPVSKPNNGRDPPGVLHAVNGPPIPREVSSSPRRHADDNGIPVEATVHPVTGQGDDIFDFDDDGVSVITQETVDELMRQLEQQQKDFPQNSLLNRVYSDDTDPVNQSFEHLKKNTGSQASNYINDFTPEGRHMSPPRLTRQNLSSETRSFFTKTTSSSQTDDFSEWKQEEQHYWDSQVAQDESTEACFIAKPIKHKNHRLKNNLQMISPSLRSLKLQRVREKVKRNVVRLNAAASHAWNNDQVMDAIILQSDTDVVEI